MTQMKRNARAPRALKLALAAAALGLLSACTTSFDARVQSFQAMPPITGQTFYVEPSDLRREGSLEFQSYAALVSAELQRKGFQPVQTRDAAALIVRVDFGAGPPTDRLGTRPATSSSSWGWWGHGWQGWGMRPGYWGSFYDPFWGPMNSSEIYSYTTYPAFLHVDIIRQADKAPLFEGRSESNTRVNDLPQHMPKLVTALFTDFPGPPARSKVVRVPTGR